MSYFINPINLLWNGNLFELCKHSNYPEITMDLLSNVLVLWMDHSGCNQEWILWSSFADFGWSSFGCTFWGTWLRWTCFASAWTNPNLNALLRRNNLHRFLGSDISLGTFMKKTDFRVIFGKLSLWVSWHFVLPFSSVSEFFAVLLRRLEERSDLTPKRSKQSLTVENESVITTSLKFSNWNQWMKFHLLSHSLKKHHLHALLQGKDENINQRIC